MRSWFCLVVCACASTTQPTTVPASTLPAPSDASAETTTLAQPTPVSSTATLSAPLEDASSAPPSDAPAKRLAKHNELGDDHAGPFHIGMLLVDGVEIPRGYTLPVEVLAVVNCGGLSPVPTKEVLAHRTGTHETLRLQLSADETRVAVIQFEPPNELKTAEGIGVQTSARSVAKAYGNPAKALPLAHARGPFCATFAAHPGLGFCFVAKDWDDALSKNARVSSICVLGT